MDCRVLAKHLSCSIIFLDTSSSTLWRCSSNSILLLKLRQRVSPILQWVSSTLSASQLNSAASVLNSINGSFHFCILTLWSKNPVSGSFHFAHFVKSSVILYSAVCSRMSTVSCIKSLRYSVESGLCITLQLWNTASRSNPVIMHCLTFWKE